MIPHNKMPVIDYSLVEEFIDLRVEEEPDYMINGIYRIVDEIKKHYPKYSKCSIDQQVHEYYREHNMATNIYNIVFSQEIARDAWVKKYKVLMDERAERLRKKPKSKFSDETRAKISQSLKDYYHNRMTDDERVRKAKKVSKSRKKFYREFNKRLKEMEDEK